MLLWVAASLVLAAVLVPWLYQIGKNFADFTAANGNVGLLGWLGSALRRADFGRYFNRSLLLAALLLLPLLFRRLRRLRRLENAPPVVRTAGCWQRGILLWATGVITAGGVVWALGMILAQVGTFQNTSSQPTLPLLLNKVAMPAIAVSVVEEWLFRGLLLGLWLRVSRPAAACIGTSLVFAFVHFLNPPPGYAINDPMAIFSGFEWLGGILQHFTDPLFIAADFLTLFGVGMVLAGARIRSGHLWLPIGLHCGWVIAFKVFNLTHIKLADGPVGSVLIGESLRTGLLPLAALALTAGICHLLLGVICQRNSNPGGC